MPITQSVFENYIPPFDNFSYFTFASSHVVSESPEPHEHPLNPLSPSQLPDRAGIPYIPLPASRLYISSASCLESGASAIRSKIESKLLSPFIRPHHMRMP